MATKIKEIEFSDKYIITTIDDGRIFRRELADFPLLFHATPSDRQNYAIGRLGDDVRWEKLDEDIHISSLIGIPMASA